MSAPYPPVRVFSVIDDSARVRRHVHLDGMDLTRYVTDVTVREDAGGLQQVTISIWTDDATVEPRRPVDEAAE